MKVAVVTGEREATIVDQPDPCIKAPFVKVKIYAALMCTEVHAYANGNVSDCLGHEAAGEVVAAEAGSKVAVGDRVVVMPQYGCGACELCVSGEHIHCQHSIDPYAYCDSSSGRATYAQYCIKQDWLCLPIPADISYGHASMAYCGLGPTFNAMQKMQVNALDTVLISGLGAVGLGGAVNAIARGARVLALESQPFRAELARSIGVEVVINPNDPDKLQQIRELTGGHGADKSVEASSAESAPAFLVEATRARGQITSVGWGGPIRAAVLVGKGQSFHGAWHWNHLVDAEAMFRTIRTSKSLLGKTISHTFPMTRIKEAWELQLTGERGKIILHPWAE